MAALPGPSGLLVADAHLIDGQYADRPQLRPILDAVLAVVPQLGEVAVRARGTLVSLVSPRRTFAVVQPTTKNRVDLGLRLADASADEQPGGRLRTARDLGPATVRVPLAAPGEVDEEVIGWLRQAYAENTAPPPPRPPARRPAPKVGTLTVVIEGSELPGRTCQPDRDLNVHRNIHVALRGPSPSPNPSPDQPALTIPGDPTRAIEPVAGDAPTARWELTVTVRRDEDGYDFTGPFVRGARDDRHLGLAWGDVPGDGTLRLFRAAKLRLIDVPPGLIANATRPDHLLVVRVRLTDAKGHPICARLRPPYIAWSAERRRPAPGPTGGNPPAEVGR